MGYTTYFSGQFEVTPPLTPEQVAYLNAFSETRRMARNVSKVRGLPDPKRNAVGLPLGDQGQYYVGDEGLDYTTERSRVIDYNQPPVGQPGLWCQWIVTEDGAAIEWNEGEKFYDYVEWLGYIVENFLTPWGRTLSGSVTYEGESNDDRGTIYAKDNAVECVEDEITNRGPSWGQEEL